MRWMRGGAGPEGGRAGRDAAWRRWALYAVAWLPLYGLYVVVFLVLGEPPRKALPGALSNVLPAAVLGVFVVAACRRVEWNPAASRRFFSIHAGLATLYAAGVAFGQFWMMILTFWIEKGVFDPGQYDRRIFPWEFVFGIMLYVIVAAPAYALRFLERLGEQEARAARAESLRSQAELRALRARLNPHFLFNTLHSLLALVREDPAAAEDALERFGDLLHYALRAARDGGDEVTLEEEWEFTRNYLALEKLRLEERLMVHDSLDEAVRGCLVPALTLQPLVENAIRHSIAPRSAGGSLWISARLEEWDLVVDVSDDGPGVPQGRPEPEAGMGLSLVRQRLEMLHGESMRFEVRTAPGKGFTVTVRVPARWGRRGQQEGAWRSAR